jgi:hypothetical protein
VSDRRARSAGYYLVEAIVAELRRLPPRPNPRPDQIGHGRAALYVAKGMRSRAVESMGRAAIQQARDGVRDILKTIETLERQLRDASPRLSAWLNPLNRRDIDPGRRAELEEKLAANPAFPLPDDRNAVLEQLDRLHWLCTTFDAQLPARDEVRYWCALDAWQLIGAFSDEMPANTAGSPFREIAGLLYVAADPDRLASWHAGTDTPDLRRACTEVHRDPRLRFPFVKAAQPTADV